MNSAAFREPAVKEICKRVEDSVHLTNVFSSSPEDVFTTFRERGRKGREALIERETSIGCILLVPLPGIEPAT